MCFKPIKNTSTFVHVFINHFQRISVRTQNDLQSLFLLLCWTTFYFNHDIFDQSSYSTVDFIRDLWEEREDFLPLWISGDYLWKCIHSFKVAWRDENNGSLEIGNLSHCPSATLLQFDKEQFCFSLSTSAYLKNDRNGPNCKIMSLFEVFIEMHIPADRRKSKIYRASIMTQKFTVQWE